MTLRQQSKHSKRYGWRFGKKRKRAAAATTSRQAGTTAALGAMDKQGLNRKLKVLALVTASFFILWLSLTVFARGEFWPLLVVPIITSAWFFYEAGVLITVGVAGLLLVQTSLEKTGPVLIVITAFATLGMLLGWGQRRQKLTQRHILRSSLTDSLTGLFNFGYFMDCLDREISRVERYGGFVTLVMFDIDHFKLLNDRYGHQRGNMALKAVAATLKREKRDSDVVARYGGEEFVLVLPEDDRAGAETAERMREAISRVRIPVGGGATTGVTVSVGVACFPTGANSKEELMDRVDQLLYASKSRGRNQVSVTPPKHRLAVM